MQHGLWPHILPVIHQNALFKATFQRAAMATAFCLKKDKRTDVPLIWHIVKGSYIATRFCWIIFWWVNLYRTKTACTLSHPAFKCMNLQACWNAETLPDGKTSASEQFEVVFQGTDGSYITQSCMYILERIFQNILPSICSIDSEWNFCNGC